MSPDLGRLRLCTVVEVKALDPDDPKLIRQVDVIESSLVDADHFHPALDRAVQVGDRLYLDSQVVITARREPELPHGESEWQQRGWRP